MAMQSHKRAGPRPVNADDDFEFQLNTPDPFGTAGNAPDTAVAGTAGPDKDSSAAADLGAVSVALAIPTDPLLLANQWHLIQPVVGLLDLNVQGAWQLGYSGAGTRTVVIDNGFDYNHADLAPNYDTLLDFDFEFNTLDPFGALSESHGTAVAGIIGADDNGTGAVGVAFDTSLVGYRTAGFITDAWLQDVRDAIHHAAVSAQGDVANISQGIANDATSEFGVGYDAARFDEIEASINTAVTSGRGGLGMTIVKSAGNSRSDNYDVNADDWTNDTRQVVVAAVNQNGFVSSYSSYGAAVLVSGFGTPGEVFTTDRVGAAGYNIGDFTASFNGTSAAAPMVSGVVQLMYDANPNLGWRDVQTILAYTARHVGTAIGGGISGFERYAWGWNAANTWNGGGLHFSNDYGYGLVDATAAVLLAETWLDTLPAQTSSNEFTNTMDMLNAAVVIPDGNPAGLTFTGNAGFSDEVERVTVQVTFSTTFTGDMEIYLTSPDGTVSELIDDVGDTTDFNGTWTFETQAFRGERSDGTWSVRIVDDAGADVLTVSDIVVRTYGRFTASDRYVFTDEYAIFGGVAGHNTITDTNGGIDSLNASAVSSNSIINLLAGSVSTIAGKSVTIAAGTSIEDAYGGIGNDIITGSELANRLLGGRGADTLKGGGDVDTLDGGAGNDLLQGGLSTDTINGGEGDDTIAVLDGEFIDNVDGGDGTDTLNLINITTSGGAAIDLASGTWDLSPSFGGPQAISGIEVVFGTQLADTVTGSFASEFFSAKNGNDVLIGGGGTDTIEGGKGNDLIQGGFNTDVIFGQDGRDVIAVLEGEFIDNVDGGAGKDTLDLSAITSRGAVIDLNTGTWDLSPSFGGLATIVGVEKVTGTAVGDTITGSATNETFNGGNGADVLNGGGGADTINGGNANDTLDGGANNDTLEGSGGADRIIGGAAKDTVTGGTGNDTFVLTPLQADRDIIQDFVSANDQFEVSAALFGGGLVAGVLPAAQFVINGTGLAGDANDRFIYNNLNGELFFDINGSAGGGGQLIATLTGIPGVSSSDFTIV